MLSLEASEASKRGRRDGAPELGLKARASAFIAALAIGCTPSKTERVATDEVADRFVASASSADTGEACADFGEARVCWSPGGVALVPRPTPARRRASGWRCRGSGEHRACEDRRHGADAFECRGSLCSQAHPRMPDDGEWECADFDGVVVCHRLSDAAGIEPGPKDPAWICGDRRGHGERVCVDLSPDRPGPEPWQCKFQYEPDVPARVCTAAGLPLFGRACGSGCPFGTQCASGLCLPQRPSADCWLDADCGAGAKCAYGSCRGHP